MMRRKEFLVVAKTYVPSLRIVLNQAYRYATRYQSQLSSSLTPEQAACLSDVVAALASCLALLGAKPVEP